MKKQFYFCFLSCLLIFSFLNLQARHILGGSMTYHQISSSEYEVRMELLRDCAGNGATFDFPAYVTIFSTSSEGSVVLDTLEPPLHSVEPIDLMAANNVCVFPTGICVEKGTYLFTISLPENTGIYTVAHQRCCRSEIINNLISPGEIGMTFSTEINSDIQNSSPNFNSDIPLANFSNVSFVYNGSATDIDGDILVYELTSPLQGGGLLGSTGLPGEIEDCHGVIPRPACLENSIPVSFLLPTYSVNNMLGGDYPLQIDTDFGEMTATPTIVGVFQIGYTVKEFRNGSLIGSTRREFMFVITPADEDEILEVGGRVLVDEMTAIDFGKVELFEHNLEADSLEFVESVLTNSIGEYYFPSIPAGVHYLKASPTVESAYYNSYMPTYYRNDLLWYESNAISECDTSDFFRDIILIPNGGINGDHTLGGRIQSSGSTQNPIGINVLLLDASNNFLKHSITDNSGYFIFENLALGNYQIFVDLLNSNIDNSNPPMINLTGSTDYDFTIHDSYLSLDGITDSRDLHILSDFRIFPNPATERLFFELTESVELLSIEIVNTMGITVLQKTKHTQLQVDISDWQKGIYFVKTTLGTQSVIEKILVQ